MSLLHSPGIGSPIGVWFNGTMPDRIVLESERYRVVSPAQPLRSGWRFLGVSDTGSIHLFEIEPLDGAHWTITRVDPTTAEGRPA